MISDMIYIKLQDPKPIGALSEKVYGYVNVMSKSVKVGAEPTWIYIDVQEARSIKPSDNSGWSDPYCLVTLGPKTKIGSTRVIERTLNPRWFQRFSWSGVINWEKDAYLRFAIHDYDFASKDDCLGVFEIALVDLQDGMWESKWYRLYKAKDLSKPTRGWIHLRMHMVDNPDKAFDQQYQKNKKKQNIVEEIQQADTDTGEFLDMPSTGR